MAIKKFTPQNSDQFVGKEQGDHMIGKFGHLNYLLKKINSSLLLFSPGSVVFSDTSGNPTGDPAKLYWNNITNRLGINTSSPASTLSVVGTFEINYPTGNATAFSYTGTNNGLKAINLVNTNSGSSAGIGFRYFNDTGTSLARVQEFLGSSNYAFGGNRFFFDALSGTSLEFGSRSGNVDFNTGSLGVSNTKLRLFNNGNVGIATNPTDTGQKLQVTGSAIISSDNTSPALDLVSNFPAGGLTILRLKNLSSNAAAGIRFLNESGTSKLQIFHGNTSYSGGGDRSYIDGLGTGGTEIGARSGNLDFNTVSTTVSNTKMRIFNNGNVAVGTNPTDVASAKLQVVSTTQGFLPPVMTGAQAEAIASPAEGLMVYATSAGSGAITAKGWWGYNGTTWTQLG